MAVWDRAFCRRRGLGEGDEHAFSTAPRARGRVRAPHGQVLSRAFARADGGRAALVVALIAVVASRLQHVTGNSGLPLSDACGDPRTGG